MFGQMRPEPPLTDGPAGVVYYRDVLGFSLDYQQHEFGAMDRDGVRVLLFGRAERHTGIGSCDVHVENVDRLHANLVVERCQPPRRADQ
jgi:hypothetical protein